MWLGCFKFIEILMSALRVFISKSHLAGHGKSGPNHEPALVYAMVRVRHAAGGAGQIFGGGGSEILRTVFTGAGFVDQGSQFRVHGA